MINLKLVTWKKILARKVGPAMKKSSIVIFAASIEDRRKRE
jgi:hypothetical protein